MSWLCEQGELHMPSSNHSGNCSQLALTFVSEICTLFRVTGVQGPLACALMHPYSGTKQSLAFFASLQTFQATSQKLTINVVKT